MALQQYPKLEGEELYGKVVYLLGSAELGVKNNPTLIENDYDLINIFGNKGTLIDGYRQVKQGSKNNKVYLCKVIGEHAVARLNLNIPGEEKVQMDGLIISSVYAHEKYNDIKIIITSEYLMFEFPKILNTPNIAYNYSDYPTLYHLTTAINRDTKSNKNHVVIQCISDINIPTIAAIHPVNPLEIYMYGGNSGLNHNKNQLYNALDVSYGLLLGDDIDRILPLNAFIDDMKIDNSTLIDSSTDYLTLEDEYGNLSFFDQLLNYCISQTQFGMITRGIMGYRTTKDKYLNDDFEGYKEYAKYFLNANLIRAYNHIDYFGLIEICIGDVYFDYGSMLGNHYTAYAGLSAGLPLKEHTTNNSYEKSVTLRNEFNNEHFLDLMENSLVGVRVSPLTDLVTVINGVTAAPKTSDFHYGCNISMIQITAYYIQKIFDKYLGKDLVSLTKNKVISTELRQILEYLKNKEIIDQYDAKIFDDANVGELKYSILLKSKYMIDFIGLSNSIKYIVGDTNV